MLFIIFRSMNVKMSEIADLITDKSDPEQVFELLDVLGQGSYGCVYKALHKQTGELFAIKILPAASDLQIGSIKKQINVLQECNDNHIVKYESTFFKDNHLWIVMEYCVGGSVTDIMQITKKKLNQNEIASILQSALKGLNYIHERRKIHRDIKAANILLDTRGFAKLADFGVSASAMNTNVRFRTHIGSPYWMSPEIIRFTEYDQKTDIWSLGITAIQMAQGQVPNSHIKPFMVIFMTKSNPIQGFKQPALWSPQFNDFVKKCLQINPLHRPQAKQLLEHPFIKKYSKGERLLSELVLNSLQEIEEFRMNQSRNSSFAEIIINDNKDAKTIVEAEKQRNNREESEFIEEPEADSMIVYSQKGEENKHMREISDTGSMVINNSMVVCKQQQEDQSDHNVLKNYINQLKSFDKAQSKCVQMLQKAINSYDEKCKKQIEKIFIEFKDKAKNDIAYLKELKEKQNNEKVDDLGITCQMLSCDDLEEFLYPNRLSQFNQTREDALLLKQSLAEKQTQSTLVIAKNRKETKSFLYPDADSRDVDNLKNHDPIDFDKFQQTSPFLKNPQSHKSSRIFKRVHEPAISVPQKYQQFMQDSDVMEFLKQKKIAGSQQHTRSNFLNYTGNKVYTEMSMQQKSTQHSISRGKNKSVKNIKGSKKHMKTKFLH